jgi:dynein heavy chain
VIRSPFSFIDKVIESPYTEEFVYLNPMGPYDLQIVKHNLIDPNNYYTMSRAGVTQFYQTETDFTSLDQWEREYFLYTKMMGIPFFKKFRMWKAFYFWKKLIRRTKTAHCRKFLEENLYILNEYLRGSLIQLREHCYSASNWTLFKVDPKNTLTLIEFQAQQEQQKEIVMRLLYKLNQDVRKIVLDACEVDLREFLISNGFRRSKDDAQVDELNQDDGDYHQKISHAEKAAIRTKCRKLTKYIRLADYFVIDTLVTLSMDRTEDVLKYVERRSELQLKAQAQAQAALLEEKKVDEKDMLRRPGKDKKIVEKPLFSVELRLDFNDDLKFTPELEEFQVSLEQAIDSAIKKIMTPKRLLNDPDFYVYTQQNVEEGDDDQSVEFKLEAMVLQDPNFVDIKHSIKQGLTKAFEAAFDYATGFTKYSDVYVQNNATDIQSFAESSIDDFSALIAK